jgi:3-oxoacyl-[acyl-carrier protein] reductase
LNLDLNGKTALVTGGSDGIGKATANRLAAEGVDVIICARRKDHLETAAKDISKGKSSRVVPITCDVTKHDDIKNTVSKAIDLFGKLDILVNNAGRSLHGHFSEITDEIWQEDLELKLMGAIRFSRAVAPYMKQNGWGRIINVTTPGGKAPGPASVPTSVTRAAGIALTKEMSLDYAKDGILVNTVCVGLIKSAQHERSWSESNKNISLNEWYSEKGEPVPIGRFGEANEAADVIVFLASERSSYITGTAINVDGGSSAVT